jgi:hypothetical protein
VRALNMLYRLLTFCIILLLIGCASDPPVPGNTDADENLRRDIRRIINILEMTSEPRCDAFTIVNTERAGLGRELWTVQRCGERVVYLVTFLPGRAGASNLSVRREEQGPTP